MESIDGFHLSFSLRGDRLTENNKLEYIKVACLVVIAVSLSVIAWKTMSQVNMLQHIQDSLNLIESRINELK